MYVMKFYHINDLKDQCFTHHTHPHIVEYQCMKNPCAFKEIFIYICIYLLDITKYIQITKKKNEITRNGNEKN